MYALFFASIYNLQTSSNKLIKVKINSQQANLVENLNVILKVKVHITMNMQFFTRIY